MLPTGERRCFDAPFTIVRLTAGFMFERPREVAARRLGVTFGEELGHPLLSVLASTKDACNTQRLCSTCVLRLDGHRLGGGVPCAALARLAVGYHGGDAAGRRESIQARSGIRPSR